MEDDDNDNLIQQVARAAAQVRQALGPNHPSAQTPVVSDYAPLKKKNDITSNPILPLHAILSERAVLREVVHKMCLKVSKQLVHYHANENKLLPLKLIFHLPVDISFRHDVLMEPRSGDNSFHAMRDMRSRLADELELASKDVERQLRQESFDANNHADPVLRTAKSIAKMASWNASLIPASAISAVMQKGDPSPPLSAKNDEGTTKYADAMLRHNMFVSMAMWKVDLLQQFESLHDDSTDLPEFSAVEERFTMEPANIRRVYENAARARIQVEGNISPPDTIKLPPPPLSKKSKQGRRRARYNYTQTTGG